MEGYHLRSRSIPLKMSGPWVMYLPLQLLSAMLSLKGLWRGRCLKARVRGGGPSHPDYFRPKWGYPDGPICLTATRSPRVSAKENLVEILDPEAETYANVWVSTSFPDLEVEVAANIMTSTSLATGQTTHTVLGVGVCSPLWEPQHQLPVRFPRRSHLDSSNG